MSPRTILIAQDVSYIPSDLREYRTIVYEDSAKDKVESVFVRINRILELNNAELSFLGKIEFPDENNKIKVYEFPEECGEFKLYTLLENDGSISEYWYIASIEKNVPIDNLLADIRVLLRKISNLDVGSELNVKFIIATTESLKSQKRTIIAKFKKMKAFEKTKTNRIFSLEIWDKDGLRKKELELGLIIDEE